MNNQYVIFKLKGESYGLPIDYVETIEKLTEITRVPHTPSYIRGVINLRGEVIPVIDLCKRFQLPSNGNTEETRIIVMSYEDMSVGILVDACSEVITLEEEKIDESSELINSFEDAYIKGIGKIDDRMIILLEIEKLLKEKKEN